MPLPLSKSQIERLGLRLVSTAAPASDDIALLHELLAAYADQLAATVERVRTQLALTPTARTKNTGTILEKLRRYGGSWLKSVHDLAGMRIVGDFDHEGQDAVASQLVGLFAAEQRAPRVIDRREEPVQGYRAVHVVAFPEGIPIEIQVRTRWQHEWADLFEKLADRVGRGIRYAEPPALWNADELARAGDVGRRLSAAAYAVRSHTVELAVLAGDLLAAVEDAQVRPVDPAHLARARAMAEEALSNLRSALVEVI